MTPDTQEYFGDQMVLFEGGLRHVRVELTAHMTGTGDTIPVGVKVIDQLSGELIAYQVPTITGNLGDLEELGHQITDVLRFVKRGLSPF